MLEARAAVKSLHAYRPPLAGREGLRLDFNESTIGCSPRVLARLRSLDAEAFARYPEREPVEGQAADFLKLDAAQVLLTNGVDEAIHLLCSTYLEPGDEAIVVVPTFAMYAIFAHAEGARVVQILAGEDFAFPLESLLSRISPGARPANVFGARTLSKAYGLAGLRIGILAGDAGQMAMVRRVASPYNVNAAALAALPEALNDQEYVERYFAEVRRGRGMLERELTSLGLQYWPSRANFVLARVGAAHAEFVQALRARGILVRDRSSDRSSDQRCEGCVRLTVGSEEHARTLIGALSEVIAKLRERREVRA